MAWHACLPAACCTPAPPRPACRDYTDLSLAEMVHRHVLTDAEQLQLDALAKVRRTGPSQRARGRHAVLHAAGRGHAGAHACRLPRLHADGGIAWPTNPNQTRLTS